MPGIDVPVPFLFTPLVDLSGTAGPDEQIPENPLSPAPEWPFLRHDVRSLEHWLDVNA
jgi:hypothetical protein